MKKITYQLQNGTYGSIEGDFAAGFEKNGVVSVGVATTTDDLRLEKYDQFATNVLEYRITEKSS